MPQSERWQTIGREILTAARTELYMHMPFLDLALSALTITDQDYDTATLATDARHLYFSGAWLAQQLEQARAQVNRAYLHTVFHCLLRHPAKTRGRDLPLWDLACDIAVESMLDALDYRCVQADKPSIRRQNAYRGLRQSMPVLTAEAIYRQFRRERLSAYDCATLARVFYIDDHSLWPASNEDEQDRQWQRTASQTQTAMETVFSNQSTGGEAVREQLAVAAQPTTDYRAFLRRFAALREEVAIDADAFDYGYYAYGLRHYGNLPLIEPLETREVRKIEDFVIAIDTSMSTSGELVRQFLSYTYSLLTDSESFFRHINLRILQCDDQLRSDKRITSARDLRAYMDRFELIGQSATDFRPVFEHVDKLVAEGAFHHLRGMIYFTDGLGIYPQKPPKYDAAFVMLEGDAHPENVPPWGIRAVLRENEIFAAQGG
nr:VWA-like domain-containing protein [uncultured Agathobaculum sp.]